MGPQATQLPVPDQHFVPDVAVSILEDPRAKKMMRDAVLKLADETAPGAKLEDDAADVRDRLNSQRFA